MKTCSSCLNAVSLHNFGKDASTKDGKKARCKPCDKLRRPSIRKRWKCEICSSPCTHKGFCAKCLLRARVIEKGPEKSYLYEKTKTGFLMRAYRNMKSRVTGVQKLKAHIYLGLPLMPRTEFYEWSQSDTTFHSLFDTWEASGYDRTISPSIDRINNNDGYVKGNVRWLTHSENSRLGTASRWRRAA